MTLEPLVDLPLREMAPAAGLFLHPSRLHGQAHVARVMVHATVLASRLEKRHQRVRLWASVYLHDLARRHDGVCYEHGARAVERYATLPDVQALFRRAGVVEADLAWVATAVTHHCKREELDRGHSHWELTALLKDADGLDRVRLGDLDVSYLRHGPSKDYAGFAEDLFTRTAHLPDGPELFERVWRAAHEALPANAAPEEL